MTCLHKNMVNMDHRALTDLGVDLIINRHCVSCGYHVYGKSVEEKTFSKTEWDTLMNSAENDQLEMFA